jgi:hypothetical protein
VYYSGGERAERGVAIVVHRSVVRSVVKKIAGTALRIIGVLKPPHHDKVEPPTRRLAIHFKEIFIHLLTCKAFVLCTAHTPYRSYYAAITLNTSVRRLCIHGEQRV